MSDLEPVPVETPCVALLCAPGAVHRTVCEVRCQEDIDRFVQLHPTVDLVHFANGHWRSPGRYWPGVERRERGSAQLHGTAAIDAAVCAGVLPFDQCMQVEELIAAGGFAVWWGTKLCIFEANGNTRTFPR